MVALLAVDSSSPTIAKAANAHFTVCSGICHSSDLPMKLPRMRSRSRSSVVWICNVGQRTSVMHDEIVVRVETVVM